MQKPLKQEWTVRMNRINAYLSPFQDAQGIGYQLVNSYLAIGSGGVKGLGLGQSVQKLGYIPEPQTDFIMAIIAEELGIFGVAFVILGLAYASALGRVDQQGQKLRKLVYDQEHMWGIKARNVQQLMATELLLRDDISRSSWAVSSNHSDSVKVKCST